MNTVKYWGGALLSLPFLPLMYYQGRNIRANVPVLPEAKIPFGIASGSSDKTIRITLLGESTIAGVGVASHQEGFAGSLATQLAQLSSDNIDWKVYAKSGFNARQVTEYLVPSILENSTDLVVIGLGGNDAFELNRPRRWRYQVLQLIEAVQARFSNTPIVFTNMPPIKEFPAFTPLIQFTIGNLVEILGDELEDLCSRVDNVHYRSEIITFNNWIELSDQVYTVSDFFSDGVHPSNLTYQLWGKDIAKFIMEKSLLSK